MGIGRAGGRSRVAAVLVALAAGLAVASPAPSGAAAPGAPTASAASAALPQMVATGPDYMKGSASYGGTLTAMVAARQPQFTGGTLQWYRGGTAIPGATGRTYKPTPADVGQKIRFVAMLTRSGFETQRAVSQPTPPIAHASPLKRTVRYDVRVDATGTIPAAEVETFVTQAQQTYDDARGWRAGGTAFTRTSRSQSQFTLVLATSDRMTSYSSVCSAQWSCRVGRNVVINWTRWKTASPAWNAAGGSLRDYRHMVVNHETGHWLGRGHAGCSRQGALAPVMMQQSKGLGGCRFNPWPLPSER